MELVGKTCSKCGEIKPLTEFYKHSNTKDKLRRECKPCVRQMALANYRQNCKEISAKRKRRYPAIRASLAERAAEYRSRPGHAEKAIERTKAWRAIPENKARHDKVKKIYRDDPVRKTKKAISMAAWQKANPDVVRAHRAKRRALKAAVGGSHTAAEIKDLLVKQDHRCANPRCRADLIVSKRHLDHIEPLSRGGSNGIKNLQWLCAPCNLSKRNMPKRDWLNKIARAA